MNFQRLIRQNETPPGGYRYRDRDTGFLITENSFGDWIAAGIRHRKANNLPVPDDFARQMETQLCENMPAGVCVYDDGTQPASPHDCRLSSGAVFRGMESVGALLTSLALEKIGIGDGPFVDQAEADRRAAICSRCHKNVGTGECVSCGAMSKIKEGIEATIGARQTESDSRLNFCCVCTCSLKTIVFVKKPILDRGMTDKMREQSPSHCWKVED